MADRDEEQRILDEGSWRRLEADLRASEARYQAIFQGARDAILIADQDGRLLDANRAALRMLGRTLEEVRRMRFPDLHPPDELEAAREAFAAHLREPEKDLDQLHVLRRDGERIPVEIGSALATVEGRTINIGTFRDLTRRHAVDTNLRFQLSLQQAITQVAARLVEATAAELDSAFSEVLRILGELCGARRALLFQLSPDGALIRNTHAWAHPDDPQRAVLNQGVPVDELPHLKLLFAAGRPFVLSRPEDLPATALAERAFFGQERRPVVAVPLANGRRRFGALSLHGSPDEVRDWAPSLVDALGLAGSVFTAVLERTRAEEERRRLELQLLHAQKLESLGVLAGGVAHDFNNLLVAILGNLELALDELPASSAAREQLRDAELAARRAADLTRQMLAYSGRGKLASELTCLSEVVEEMLHILQVSISKKAALHLSLARELPAIEADPGQLRQVVMNLVVNASEAIGEASGAIGITTGAIECDRDLLASTWVDDDLAPGRYVFLEVVDSGHGMTREEQSRIFDPFYTTKFTGRGLGLAAVFGIVRGHRGAIQVQSAPGKGTTFRVLFPASQRTERATPAPRLEAWRGSGTVLLVDDEESVRATGRKMLERLGFEVLLAGDGIEAMELLLAHPEIRLILLDLTMPRRDGAEAFPELCHARPDLRILVTSGYSEQDLDGRFAGPCYAGFLQKPFRLATVTERVRAALGA